MAEIKEISNEDLILIKSYVAYDESSPSCLIWINNAKYTNRIGKCAGSIVRDGNKDRYFEITINYRRFSCHRIVAALHGKDVNNFYIDHIDGNGLNNKIENLRTVTVGGNQRNRKRQDRNRSGITGVRLIKCKMGLKQNLMNTGKPEYMTLMENIYERSLIVKLWGLTTLRKWLLSGETIISKKLINCF